MNLTKWKFIAIKEVKKFSELYLNNKVEICWLISKSKCQFRFRGNTKIDLGKDRLIHWDQLGDKSKSMWLGHVQVIILSIATKTIYQIIL